MAVINSATGITSQIPLFPNSKGYIIMPITISTSPRKKEMMADVSASPLEVKKLEANIFAPFKKKQKQ